MKKLFYILLAASFFSSCNNGLDEQKVNEFITTHFAEKVGGEEAINKLKEDAGDSIIMYNLSNGWIGRPEWVNDNSKIKAEWFYEDSLIAEVKNIEVFGNVASVYGNVSAYIGGIKVQRSGFHSIVGKQMGKLVFKRHSWINWNINRSANSFVWPSTEVEGALAMYNRMRYAMANFRNNDASAISDSLVELDPNLAVAHIGKLHYFFINGERDNLVSLMKKVKSNLEGASLAEKYYLETFTPSSSRAEILKKYEKALLYAANDPLLRAFYSYYLEEDLKFLAEARKAIKEGDRIYYSSWW